MRCKEFYEKWKRCGNFCEKHKVTAEEIDKYLTFIEEIENRADVGEQIKKGISELSADSLRPLINEPDEEIREGAIKKISEDAIGKQHAGRGHKKEITGKAVVKALAKARQEVKGIVELPVLEEGKYRTIVIDPPWEIEKIQRDVRPNQTEMDYPLMSVEEIKNFPIHNSFHKEGCHIYLWTTHKHLPDALDIFNIWGVKYQCLLTWIKNVGITPFSWMYSTELVLFGRVGALSLLKNGLRIDFSGKVREHSRKPDEFYELIKQVSPMPRIDVFSREKREGFDQYGNEIGRF